MNKKCLSLFIAVFLLTKMAFAQGGANIRTGDWLCKLQLNDSTSLPFHIRVKGTNVMILNGEEQIVIDYIKFDAQDSVFMRTPFFESEFRIKMTGDSVMTGSWINRGRKDKNVIPFSAHVLPKLTDFNSDNWNFAKAGGRWEVTFSPDSKDDSYKAVGLFKTDYRTLSGTFLTETGDYRYLYGEFTDPATFYMSCFDGAHAFLFRGKVKGDSIVNGRFYSGAHWQEPWGAKRNDKFELRNPDSLTYLKPGYSKIDFSFKDLEGKMVSLSDEKYKNKVVIVQLMGTWCPNCVDETRFLSGFQALHSEQGLKVIALAFERTDDFDKAVKNVINLKTRFRADYDFLITMKAGKDQASQALPMLNGIMAFPTTIFIDKKGVVRKIYTGFNGPATGDAYTRYVEETTRFVETLLKE